MREQTYDLTQGPILKKLLLVAVPIMGTQFMQMTYNLTDMFWLGRMQAATVAVAASGMAGMFLWLSMALLSFGRMGAEIGVSQNLGRGDQKAAQSYAQQAFMLALLLGVLYGLCMILFAEPLLSLFQIQEKPLFDSAVSYMRITGVGIPLTYVSAALTGAFNGSGNSRLSFWANFIGLLVNMALDPLMIFTFGMGIEGAALATVVAQGASCALFIYFILRHRERPFAEFRLFVRPHWEHLMGILRWGAPIALESGLFTLLAMTITRLITGFGQDALAVQRVGGQIESLSWLIGGGFSSAVTAFVGQNYGARKWGRIREGYRISQRIMTVYGLCITALLFFLGRQLFWVFLRDEAIQRLGAHYLKILCACQFTMCLEASCSGVFRGIGKTLPPSASSIASNILRVPLCYALAGPFGLYGVWVGVTATAILRGVAILIWYTRTARNLPQHDEAVAGV